MYELAKAYSVDQTLKIAFEFPLYFDARVVGELDIGYIQLINTVPVEAGLGTFRQSIIVRSRWWGVIDAPTPIEMGETQTDLYHGGGYVDEIASVVSLLLGCRVQAGSISREFDGDVFGRPVVHMMRPAPTNRSVPERSKFPTHPEVCNLDEDTFLPMRTLASVTSSKAALFIKAARLYQEAVILTEWEPERAWLLYVSSIEVLAAAESGGVFSNSDDEVVEQWDKDIYELIRENKDRRVIERLAIRIREEARSARKFTAFLLKYSPDAPTVRPIAPFRIVWVRETLGPMFDTIYKHRSKALHGGIAFPMPMCSRPAVVDGIAAEKPLGLSASTHNASWQAKDAPMHIHVFEYLVRLAILTWYGSGMR